MSNIKCGKCKGYHAYVAEVKTCYNGGTWFNHSKAPVATQEATENLQSLLSVPAGRYAIADGVNPDDGLQHIKFYKIDRPTEGRWKGYTFVKRLVADGFGLVEYPVRGTVRGKSRENEILAAIAIDPQAAAILYGQELGVCGVCNRTLTDDTSRAYGIGPICRAKTGW